MMNGVGRHEHRAFPLRDCSLFFSDGFSRRARTERARASLSADTALQIEKATCISMATLMRMQTSFDIAATRDREGDTGPSV